MTSHPANDEPLEPLLDALPPGPERDAAFARLREAGRGGELDALLAIDDSLHRLFPAAEAPAAQVEAITTLTAGPAKSQLWRRAVLGAGLGAAAAVLAAVLLPSAGGPAVAPYFEPTELAALYRDAVDNGFEPYYECEDDDRFAAVFEKRQDAPLVLKEMPPGSRMLGLSYPGGFSRDTTAMLCEVDGQPVMVFVDRQDADRPELADLPAGSGLRVFRSELPGVVLYEVTPLDEPRAASLLAPATR
ncbi:hypothetical protein Pla123a_13480 [Posidoniimonas polymericola]|uniref:DUF3379 domain-containing protein n=1 Tax=Posidoniimonas polymericola TaxID=2528002 RepID=A0A5C5YUC7_9BACT|nr:hypothetical protein [Posidoniimonas polymericola]TWT78555.1 hypothetical protein Pla123a_13480 [Posidoniimonas polymericola]